MDSKTAFVLGGGGARGAYEIGVWQALREMNMKIDIITGCSVGAINGALVAQDSFDLAVDLWKEIQTDMVVDIGFPIRKNRPLKELITRFIDEDKIRNSGITFGLVTVELPNLTPRYFFLEDIPKGKLADYIIASASLFPAIRVADIDNVKYVDGGYLDNLPVGMALDKGATHVIAVDLETAGYVQKEPLRQAENLVLIRCKWKLGDVMIFDGKGSPRNIRLGYLDTLKAFGFYDGYYYCFSKGEMNKRTLDSAETAARIFDLDPQVLFSKDSFLKTLKTTVRAYRSETEAEISNFHVRFGNSRHDRETLFSLFKKINPKSITLVIADLIHANNQKIEGLLAKPLALLFKEESRAANYLIREKLI